MSTRVHPSNRTLRAALLGSAAALVLSGAAQALPDTPTILNSSNDGSTTFDYGTANTLNVNQGDTFVVIDWRGFNIGTNETVNFNQPGTKAISFNFVDPVVGANAPPATFIDGHLNANGGVFIFDPNGVIFGSNARVDVGAFGVFTGAYDSEGEYGELIPVDESDFTVWVEPNGTANTIENITVTAGAQIKADAGFVVLQSESIVQNGQINATDGVVYLVGEGGYINVDLDSPTLVAVTGAAFADNGTSQPAFSHGATASSTGLFIALETPRGTVEDGYHGVINLEGTLTATGIGGEGGIYITADSPDGPEQSGATDSSFDVDATGAILTSGGDINVAARGIALGSVDAGNDVNAFASNSISVSGLLQAGGDVDMEANGWTAAGDLSITGGAQVGGDMDLYAYDDLTLAGTVNVDGDLTAYGEGDVHIQGLTTAGGDIDLDAGYYGGGVTIDQNIVAGGDFDVDGAAFVAHGDVSAQGDADINVDGSIAIDGDVSAGGYVQFYSYSLGSTIRVGGAVTAGNGLEVAIDPDVGSAGFGGPTGDIDFGGPLNITGDLDIYTAGSQSVSFHDNVTVSGDFGVYAGSFYSSGPIAVEGDGQIWVDTDLTFDTTADSSFASLDLQAGNVSIDGDLHVDGLLMSSSTRFETTGALDVGQLDIATHSGNIILGGTVDVADDAQLTIDGRGGVIQTEDRVTIGGDLDVSIDGFASTVPNALAVVNFFGPITVEGSATLAAFARTGQTRAGSINIEDLFDVGGSVTANTRQFDSTDGDIRTGTDLTLRAVTGAVIGDGDIGGNADIIVSGGGSSLSFFGDLNVDGNLGASVSGLDLGPGNIFVDGDVTVGNDSVFAGNDTVGNFSVYVDGSLSANGFLVVSGRYLETTGAISGGDIQIFTTNGINLGGQTTGDKSVILESYGDIEIGGAFRSYGNAVMDGDELITTADGTIDVGTDLELQFYEVDAAGDIHVGGGLDSTTYGDVTLGGDLDVGGSALFTIYPYSGAMTVDGATTVGGDLTVDMRPGGEGWSFGDPVFGQVSFNGPVTVGGDVDVTILGGDWESLDGEIYLGSLSAGGSVNLAAGLVDATGRISGDDVNLTAAHGDVTVAGGFTTDGTVTINADSEAIIGGPSTIGGDLEVDADDGITLTGAVSAAGYANLWTGDNAVIDGNLSGALGVDFSAFGISGTGGVSSGQGIVLSGANGIHLGGGVVGGGSGATTLTSGGGISVGALSAGTGGLSAETSGDFSSGATSSAGTTSITSTDGALSIGSGDFDGDVTLHASESVVGVITLGATDVDGDLTTVSYSLVTTGAVNVTGDLNIDPPGDVVIGADMTIGGAATITAMDGLYVNGDLTVGGNLDLIGGTVNSTGDIDVTGTLDVNGTNGISLGGATTSTGAMTLVSSGAVTITGDLTAPSLSVTGDTFTASGASHMDLGGSFSLTTNGQISFGGAEIDGNLSLTTNNAGAMVETNGALTVHGDLDITVHGNSNASGSIYIRQVTQVDGDTTFHGDAWTHGQINGNTNTDGDFNAVGLRSFWGTAGFTNGGDVNIQTGAGGIRMGAGNHSSTAGGAFNMVSTGSISVEGYTRGQTGLNISGSTGVTTNTTGALVSGANLGIGSDGDIMADGSITAANDLNIGANGDIGLSGAIDVGGEANVLGDLSSDLAISGETAVAGDLSVYTGGDVAFFGPLTVGGDLDVHTYSDIVLNAVGSAKPSTVGGDAILQASGDVFVGSALTVDGGLGLYGGDVSTAADGDLTVGSGGLTAEASGLFSSFGDISVDGDAYVSGRTIALNGDVDVSGSFEAYAYDQYASITVDGDLTVGGTTVLGAHTQSEGGDPGEPSGEIIVNGDVNSTGNVSIKVYGQDNASADGYVEVNGDVTTEGDVTLSARSILVEGDIVADGDFDLDAGYDAALAGSLTVGGDADMDVYRYLAITGLTSIDGDLTATGANVTTGAPVTVGGDLSIITGFAMGLGKITVGGDAYLEVVSPTSTLSLFGVIEVDGELIVISHKDLEIAGGLQSGGDMTLTAVTDIDITGLVAAGGGIDIETGGVLTANAGIAANGGELDILAGRFTGSGYLYGRDFTTIDTTAGVTSSGTLASNGLLTVRATGASADVNVNNILALQVDVEAGRDVNAGSLLKSYRFANIDAGRNITLNGGAEVGLGDATFNAGGTFYLGGESTFEQDLNVTSVGGLTLAGDSEVFGDALLRATGPTSLITVGGPLTVDGDLTTRSFAFHNLGAMTIGGDLDIDPGGDIVIDAPTTVSGDASLVTDDNIIINASLDVGGALLMDAIDITSAAAGTVDVGNGLTVYAGGDVTIAGQMTVGGNSSLDVGGDFSNSGSGTLSTGGDLDITTGASLTFGAAVNVGGDMHFDADGDLTVNAGITANGAIEGSADDIHIAGVTIRSDALGEGEGGVSLEAGRDFTAAANSLIIAGPLQGQGQGTDVVSIVGGGNAGGDATLGRITGTAVYVRNYGGDITANGAINAGIVQIFNNFDLDPGIGGDIDIAANVTGSNVAIINRAGEIAVSGGVTVQGSSQAFVQGSNDVVVNGAVTGAAAGVLSGETLTIGANGQVTSTGTTTAPAWPTVGANMTFATENPVPVLSGVTLGGNRMTISGSVTAGPSGNRAEVFIQPLGTQNAGVTIGGSSGSGFRLTNADLGRITARNVVVLGGAADGRGAGYDLTVADVTLDSQKVGGLWVGTQSTHKITVSGAVAGTGAVRIGFAQSIPGQQGPTGNPTLISYIPGEIDILGSLGSAEQPLGSVGLLARNDIFMGSSEFVSAARDDADFDAVEQSGDFASPGEGHVFVGATVLEMAAQGRIIQQDTEPSRFEYGGLAIGAPTAEHPLISAMTGLEGRTFGAQGQAWTAHFGAGPTAIDLFGAIDAGGVDGIISDERAAKQENLLASSIVTSDAYRINTCIFGATCARGGEELPRFEPPPEFDPGSITDTFADDGGAGGNGNALEQTLPVSEETEEETERKNQAPVTGSGNGDLWPEGSGPPRP